MDKVPISFDEKIDARFERKGPSHCWLWNGSVCEGRPAINLRDVMRYIYEREIGPVPPGMLLHRTDHVHGCRSLEWCVHRICVNPWHVEPRPSKYGTWGTYTRENSWSGTDTAHVTEYQRRGRARRKKKNHGDDRDPQGLDAAPDVG